MRSLPGPCWKHSAGSRRPVSICSALWCRLMRRKRNSCGRWSIPCAGRATQIGSLWSWMRAAATRWSGSWSRFLRRQKRRASDTGICGTIKGSPETRMKESEWRQGITSRCWITTISWRRMPCIIWRRQCRIRSGRGRCRHCFIQTKINMKTAGVIIRICIENADLIWIWSYPITIYATLRQWKQIWWKACIYAEDTTAPRTMTWCCGWWIPCGNVYRYRRWKIL